DRLSGRELQRLPSRADEPFERRKASLVVHRVAALDPVAEIDRGEPLHPGGVDQPQDDVGSEAALRLARLEEAVDGRETVDHPVRQTGADERTSRIAKL